jgi:hypothetical protein
MENIQFLKRVAYTDYIADQTVTIGSGGGTDTVEDIPKPPSVALEVEIEGKRFVLLAYETKS